jgi:UDPglucose 6-dehydrogenase
VKICVIGAGYVGLVTSACLAYLGNDVIAIDADQNRVQQLQNGTVPFYEPHLQELVKECLQAGKLQFSDNLDKGVKQSEVIFIAVGTPSLSDGEPDLSQVMTVARAIGRALDSKHRRYIVNKSTVPVGSGNWVEMLVSEGLQSSQPVAAGGSRGSAPAFTVVSNPEFLREGSAIFDTFYPDRIVIGSADSVAVEVMQTLYEPIINQTFKASSLVERPKNFSKVPVLVTDLASAEMIKYSANAFLAMKISFANEISTLCEKVGADIRQVTRGIGFDQRIGAQFLNAGVGWGGSCFAKDLKALIQVAREYSCPTALLEAAISVNQRQRFSPITKLQQELKIIKGRTIGLLGLAFKPNTDDLRDAPSLTIAAQLLKMGARVNAYDPVTNQACARQYPELNVSYCNSLEEVANNADALVLVTEWSEFLNADWQQLAQIMRKPILIDGRNFLPEQTLVSAGFTYRGIGC